MAEGTNQKPQSKPTSANASGTTSKSSNNSGSGAGLIAGLIILGSIPFLVAFGLVIGMFRAAGPNPSGATIPQKINVASPTSELRNLLSVYSGASDIQTYLQNNGEVLTKYSDTLTLLLSKIESNASEYSTVRDRNGIITLIPIMQEQINVIRADVTSAQKEKLVADVKAFAINLKKLDVLIAPDIVALATKYASENEASGYTKYPYEKKRREEFLYNKVGHSDCSSFVSGMLYQLGYIRATHNFTTTSLYQAAKRGNYGLTVIAENEGDEIADSRTRELIQPGDIILSANRAYSRGSGGQEHAVMYIGNNQVVQSTNADGKNGIQISTLDERFGKSRTQAIIRPGGAQ